jgi:UMF1 family MFS transporter
VVVSCIMVAGACGLAGLWVAGRKLLIELAPPDKIGEYFGLYGITIKVSVVGTLLFSLITDWGESVGSLLYGLMGSLPGGADMHWNYRLAILAQLVMLVPGILLLWSVRPEKGDGE